MRVVPVMPILVIMQLQFWLELTGFDRRAVRFEN